jgi:hypothetical protein
MRIRSLLKRVLASLAVITTYGSAGSAQDTAALHFRRLLSTLYSAVTQGDSMSARALVADDLVWVVGSGGAMITKSQLLAAVSAPSLARFEIDSLRTHQYGATVVVDYVRHDHWPLGKSEFTTSWRALAVFVRTDHGWQLVRHTLSWLARPVQPVAVDSTALQPFVGLYQIAPGYIDNVHWESGHLVATASGQAAGAQLVPVSATAFSPDGIGAVITFERDASGRVIGYVQAYPDGRVIRAPRLPDRGR